MISSVGSARMVKLDSRGPLLPPPVIYEVTSRMGQFRPLGRFGLNGGQRAENRWFAYPWQTPLVACDEPVFFTLRKTSNDPLSKEK